MLTCIDCGGPLVNSFFLCAECGALGSEVTEPTVEAQKHHETFRGELCALLNRHNRENASNTPDYVLADYLIDCLFAFEDGIRRRAAWYRRQPDDPKFSKGLDPKGTL